MRKKKIVEKVLRRLMELATDLWRVP